jgi:hypothetical protein
MEIVQTRSLLQKLPPELREKIFKPNLQFRVWSAKFPALIAALRGEPNLYSEALAILYKINQFKLNTCNELHFRSCHQMVLGNIRHLFIDIDKTPL